MQFQGLSGKGATHFIAYIFRGVRKVACMSFEYFISKFSKLICHRSSFRPCGSQLAWDVLLVLDTRYLLEPGIYANPGKLQELVLYISVSLVRWSTDLLPKLSQIMQNKTVDHGLTHQTAQCNWSVFVQDMPGKTPAVHLV